MSSITGAATRVMTPESGGRVRRLALAFVTAVIAVSGSARGADAPARAPSPDPRDLNGIWYGTGFQNLADEFYKPMEGGEPPFTAQGLLSFKAHQIDANGHQPLNPLILCAPHGVTGSAQNASPHQIIQTPGQITFVYESDHDYRIIHMNRGHPASVPRTFMGDSVGHWEGDTLVIDSIGLRSDVWLDFKGTPAGNSLRVTERIRKINGGKVLENVMTIDDPEMYTRPWSTRRIFLWRPNERIGEEICEENNDRDEPGIDPRSTPLARAR